MKYYFILICFGLFACKKSNDAPAAPVDNCGTISHMKSEDASTVNPNVFKLKYTLTIKWNDGTTGDVVFIAPNTTYKEGGKYCK